jgi:hypothetical protein
MIDKLELHFMPFLWGSGKWTTHLANDFAVTPVDFSEAIHPAFANRIKNGGTGRLTPVEVDVVILHDRGDDTVRVFVARLDGKGPSIDVTDKLLVSEIRRAHELVDDALELDQSKVEAKKEEHDSMVRQIQNEEIEGRANQRGHDGRVK